MFSTTLAAWWIAILTGGSPSGPTPAPAPPVEAVAIVHARVIDMTGSDPIDDATVLVVDGRIAAVGPTDRIDVPAGARTVDATGKTVIPGLWDMHVHLTDATEIALPALVAHGVTGVRDMGGDLATIDAWRAEIRAGERIGPRIVRPGPYVDGPKPEAPFRREVSGPEEARAAVRDLAARGVDFVKIHNAVPREAFFALADEAAETGIPFVGHVPKTVEPIEAVESGQASLEHAVTFFEGTFMAAFSDPRAMLEGLAGFVESGGGPLIDRMVDRGTRVTPALVATEVRGRRARLDDDPPACRRYLAASLLDQWERFFPVTGQDREPAVATARQRFTSLMIDFTGRLHAAGVPLLAGSDLAARDVCPGSSLHDELELLVDAGLTPIEALATATVEPARFLGLEESAGTIEPGKRADLVILDADPTVDVRNVGRVRAVVAGGRVLDRAELDAMLARVAEAAPDR